MRALCKSQSRRKQQQFHKMTMSKSRKSRVAIGPHPMRCFKFGYIASIHLLAVSIVSIGLLGASSTPSPPMRRHAFWREKEDADHNLDERSSRERLATTTTTCSSASLDFYGSMLCGAISRSVAKTLLHPANTAKTIAQTQGQQQVGKSTSILSNIGAKRVAEAALEGTYAGVGAGKTTSRASTLVRSTHLSTRKQPHSTVPIRTLFRGAGAQFLLSSFLGATNFAILEQTRKLMDSVFVQRYLPKKWGKGHGVIGAGKDFIASCVSTTACSVLSIPHMVIMDNVSTSTD